MPKPYNALEGGSPPEMVIDLHDGTDEKVSIIIVHKDNPREPDRTLKHLNICLQSICVCSLNNNYEIIVIDNGSQEQGVHDFLDDIESQDVKVVRNRENLYWAAAANQGVVVADKKSKYFIFLHPDVVVLQSGWIDMMVNVCESQDSGLVGLSTKSYHLQSKVGTEELSYVEEWCMLVSRDCWQDCGPFHEELKQVGAPFMFSHKAAFYHYKPQILGTGNIPIVHHYGIFAMTVSEFEAMAQHGLLRIPRLYTDLAMAKAKTH